MSGFPWFRVYNEIAADRKIGRAATIAGLSKMHALGTWISLLALASESPQRGVLLVSDGVYVTIDEILADCDLPDTRLITAFETLQMLDRSGDGWAIANWDKRQPASDNSSERVRRHRKTKRNETVTPPLPLRNGNEPDIDIDIDSIITITGPKKVAAGRLATYYQQQAKRDPPGLTAAQMWEDDCLTILDCAGGDEAQARQLMDEARAILDGLSYTHTEPGSLLKTIEQQLRKRNKKRAGGKPRAIKPTTASTLDSEPYFDVSTGEYVYPDGRRVAA